jgi:hypothetical protein
MSKANVETKATSEKPENATPKTFLEVGPFVEPHATEFSVAVSRWLADARGGKLPPGSTLTLVVPGP